MHHTTPCETGIESRSLRSTWNNDQLTDKILLKGSTFCLLINDCIMNLTVSAFTVIKYDIQIKDLTLCKIVKDPVTMLT